MTSPLKEVIFFLSLFAGVSATAKVLLSKMQEVEGELVRFFLKTKGSACRFAVTICDREEVSHGWWPFGHNYNYDKFRK